MIVWYIRERTLWKFRLVKM